MKKMIKASTTTNNITRYINQAIRNVANYAFDNAPFDLDDPRNDYYVENIVEDIDVQTAKTALVNALETAIERNNRY